MSSQQMTKSLTLLVVLVIIRSSVVISDGLTVDDIDWSQMALLLNESCDQSGCWADLLDGPPDAIAFMPPPPLPPFLQLALADNHSLDTNENCNLCHIFGDPNGIGDEIMLQKPEAKDSDSWLLVLVATILGSTLFGALFLLFLVKCKKWKIFPVSDSCPILPESFLGGHKSAPPPCSPSDSCISPVVNEKSPQSVITDAPMKKTSISSKYWKRGPNLEERQGTDISSEMDPYSDAASCTSSPVYAELDPSGVTHALSTPTPIILSGPSINPYAVCNTYTEVADAVRMAALGSSSALLPDASYDNAAYLPSVNNPNDPNNVYLSRSLRRAHRSATLGQLGSATPLLQSHYHMNGSPQLNYLTGGRPLKKPRPLNSQIRLHDDIQANRLDRHVMRRQHGLYSDLPVHSPAMTTFGGRHAFRENPKRPLPPVPGVRL